MAIETGAAKVLPLETSRTGRPAAGNDPAKRDQILDGAHRIISRMGFDAASMNDITREAGVSKGTVYVYFPSKEDLFEALMDRSRNTIFAEIDSSLDGSGTVDQKLRRYARTLASVLCSDTVIQAHRTVFAVSERMPELGKRFYERGALRGQAILIAFLQSEIEHGTLVIPDVSLAAAQLAELAKAGLFRKRLFGVIPTPPSAAEIAHITDAAVAMFMAFYGVAAQKPDDR